MKNNLNLLSLMAVTLLLSNLSMTASDILTVDTNKLTNPNNLQVLVGMYVAHQVGQGPIANVKSAADAVKKDLAGNTVSCPTVLMDFASLIASVRGFRDQLAQLGLAFNLDVIKQDLPIKTKDGKAIIASFNNLDGITRGAVNLLNPKDKDGNVKPDAARKADLEKAGEILGIVALVLTGISNKVAKIDTGSQTQIETGARSIKVIKNNAVIMMKNGLAALAKVVSDCAATATKLKTELEKSAETTQAEEISESFDF